MSMYLTEMGNDNITVVGGSGVGKSSLFFWFKEGRFVEDIKTHRTDLTHTKSLLINQKKVSVTLHDTPRIERNNPGLISTYLRRARVVMFIYDITNQESFDCLSHWGNEAVDSANTIAVLVGNKADEEDERAVSKSREKQFADNFGIPTELIFEVSAKTGDGVESMFEDIAKAMYGLADWGKEKRTQVTTRSRSNCRCC